MGRIFDFIKRIIAMRRRNKILLGLAILFVLFLIVRGRPKPVKLEFAAVTKKNVQTTVSASGVFSGKNVASLHFMASERLNFLGISNGDNVTKGQLIASLDSTSASVALQEALNTRRNTQAAVDNIHDQVKDHAGDETFSQKATRTAAEVANDNAYDAVRAAQRALQETSLYAPFSGVAVVSNSLNVGQNVTAADVIAQIVDFSEKDFDATVDESDIGQIKIGQNAIVTLNAYGEKEFKGSVIGITPTTKTDSTGAITVTVKIRLYDQSITNIYGLNGNADIITASKNEVLAIPQEALIDDTHVYVKTANAKTEKREIQTGIKSNTDAEVTSGLVEGEEVVTNPQAVK